MIVRSYRIFQNIKICVRTSSLLRTFHFIINLNHIGIQNPFSSSKKSYGRSLPNRVLDANFLKLNFTITISAVYQTMMLVSSNFNFSTTPTSSGNPTENHIDLLLVQLNL